MSSWIRKGWDANQRYILAEMPRAFKASRILRDSREELEVKVEEDQYPDVPKKSSVIGVLAEDEKTRRKTLEEKARGNLLALTVCSSLVFTGFSFMATQGVTYILWGHNILTVLFLLPVTYFVAAAISAVKALEIGEFYSTTIEDQALQPYSLKTKQLNYVKLNEISTLNKANWTTVSFSCLRNAVISLLLFVCLIAFSLSGHNTIPKGQLASPQSSTGTASPAGGPTNAPGMPCFPCNSSESRGKDREQVRNRTHSKSGATKSSTGPCQKPVQ
jgi:hypothetical protein